MQSLSSYQTPPISSSLPQATAMAPYLYQSTGCRVRHRSYVGKAAATSTTPLPIPQVWDTDRTSDHCCDRKWSSQHETPEMDNSISSYPKQRDSSQDNIPPSQVGQRYRSCGKGKPIFLYHSKATKATRESKNSLSTLSLISARESSFCICTSPNVSQLKARSFFHRLSFHWFVIFTSETVFCLLLLSLR
jgi:hypothetical protein